MTGTELTGFVRKELDFDVDKVTFWTDSKSVLGSVCSTARRYRTFVANRIVIIQSKLSSDQWRHEGTAENPADVSSRGYMPNELSENEMWFRVPAFLRLPESEWSVDLTKPHTELDCNKDELLKCHKVSHTQ